MRFGFLQRCLYVEQLTNNLQFFVSLIILTYVSEEQNSQIFKSVLLYTQHVLPQNDHTYKHRFTPQ
jgi:hypothetical protein